MIRSLASAVIRRTLLKVVPEARDVSFSVDEPATGIETDLASNAALLAGKLLGRAPFEVADLLAKEIGSGSNSDLIRSAEPSRNGFLNLELMDPFLRSLVTRVCAETDRLGAGLAKSQGKIMIEFVSANPTGPLHIGHGRGASLGDSLARIYRQCGYSVVKEYYINDIGVQMQILANSVEARVKEEQGSTAPFLENGYHGEYIREIAREMMAKGRTDYDVYPKQYILDWIRRDLEEFGVPLDSWFSESNLHKAGKVEEVLNVLRQKNHLMEKDGALWFSKQGTEDEMDKDRVLKKSDGRYTYFASDIAYHKDKIDRGFELCIDIWGHDHHGYVPRVEASMAALGIQKEKLKLLLYQLVSLKRGGKRVAMSTRAGQFITLKEVVDEVGRDAARFFFALRSPNSQLDFDVDLAKKQSNENPVFYVQYVHARICSIFRESEKRGITVSDPDLSGISRPLEKAERELIKKLGFFPDILEACIQISSPHLLATYLMDLATRFHKFYDACRVLDEAPAVRDERLKFLRATQIVVKLGLSLLGVSAPEKM